ncbi:MAG: helix-turn-helix domain-containing protein [Firmicutes bacterium]|nr:helix-turn-helix domain-containing protein [Bacillota bacterium]
MKTKLTLQEKLRDLREERKLKLADVSEATGIPTSTLQRFESEDTIRVGYQDIEVLTRFYEVSADYLFGLTDNRQYRNVGVDKLRLSDEAIALLTSGKINNRLLSELIAHPDFVDLLAALEVYIDGYVAPKIETTNRILDLAIRKVKKKSKKVGHDEIMAALIEGKVDPDDYIRFRLTRRFDKLAQSLYTAHTQPQEDESAGAIEKMFDSQLDKYEKVKEKTGSEAEVKLAVLADNIGVDIEKAPAEEKQSLLNLLGRSKFAQLFKKRK